MVAAAAAMAATGAIPFSGILVLQIVGFLRALREERPGAGAAARAGGGAA